MKLFVSLFSLSLFCLLSIEIANQVFFAPHAAAQSVMLADAKDTKTTLSNDLKFQYENISPDAAPENALLANWGVIVLGLLSFAEVIVRVTPSEKDNSLVNLLAKIINAIIPNRKKGGGLL